MKFLIRLIYKATLVSALVLSPVSHAAEDGMVSMPKISPKAIYEVKDPEALQAESGFGNEAPSVKMMNLMMVEGSGMEGMDMSQMKMAQNETPKPDKIIVGMDPKMKMNPRYQVTLDSKNNAAKVGVNSILFNVKDSSSGKLAEGLKLKAQVSMTSMDMGTEEPDVKEISPGVYAVKAGFSMQGPWAIKIELPNGESQIFNYEAKKK